LLPWDRIWNPIYKWQKKQSENEEWANCLGVSDTRRFISFVLEAHQGNWATHDLQTGGTHRFKDDPDCVTLARTVKKLKKFKRPSVSRRFS